MNETLEKLINHRATKPVAVGAIVLGSGLAALYIYRKRTKLKPLTAPAQEELADIAAEVEEMRAKRLEREEKIARGEAELVIEDKGKQFVEEILVVQEPSDEPVATVTVSKEPVAHNIFAGSENFGEWDYEEEAKKRNPNLPYVIHRDEFFSEDEENEGYHQTQLTYYAGDDVMADEDEKPVYNYGNIVGELKFGYGSGDENVVYVRNESRKAQYEIVYDPGLFSVEVLGLEIEDNARVNDKDLRHSVARFRPGD